MWNADRRPGQDIPTAEWRQEDPGVMPAGDVYGAGAPTGMAFYEGDAFGPEWRGTLFSGEAARNTILGYRPKPDGAGFKLDRFIFATSNPSQVLAGVDSKRGKMGEDIGTFFRPSDVTVGPDGAIYIADWFDPRVGGHQDLDDQTAGAIYRVAPKGFKSVVPKFDLDTTDGQLKALCSPAVNVRALGYVKLHAQGAAAVGPVAALLKDENPYIRNCWMRPTPMRASPPSVPCAATTTSRWCTRPGSRPIRRRPCAARWPCRCAMCRSPTRRTSCSRWPRVTTAWTARISRPGASAAWARRPRFTPRSPPGRRKRTR